MGFFDKVRDALTSSDAERSAADEPAASAATEAAPSPVTDDVRRPQTYTVRTGDTLADIADRLGVDAEEMARLNKLDNPDLIYAGQVFKVPHA